MRNQQVWSRTPLYSYHSTFPTESFTYLAGEHTQTHDTSGSRKNSSLTSETSEKTWFTDAAETSRPAPSEVATETEPSFTEPEQTLGTLPSHVITEIILSTNSSTASQAYASVTAEQSSDAFSSVTTVTISEDNLSTEIDGIVGNKTGNIQDGKPCQLDIDCSNRVCNENICEGGCQRLVPQFFL